MKNITEGLLLVVQGSFGAIVVLAQESCQIQPAKAGPHRVAGGQEELGYVDDRVELEAYQVIAPKGHLWSQGFCDSDPGSVLN